MNAVTRIPWRRLSVESVAIVISILVAFGIDAWWAEKKERAVEQEALHSLRNDFESSRQSLSRTIQYHEGLRGEFAYFSSATPAELTAIDIEAIGPIVMSLKVAATFDPFTNTLDSLTSDGRLGLISNPQLRENLSLWLRALDDIRENSIDLRAESSRVSRAMEEYGGPFHNSLLSDNDRLFMPIARGADLALMQQDTEFMGKARSHQNAIAFYLRELRILERILADTLAVLELETAED